MTNPVDPQTETQSFLGLFLPFSDFMLQISTPLDSRDPEEALKSIGQYVPAFYFYDLERQVVVVGNQKFVGRPSGPVNDSGVYFIDGEVLDENAVQALSEEYFDIKAAMKANGWTHVVRCNDGSFSPYIEGSDHIIARSTPDSPSEAMAEDSVTSWGT